MRESILKVLNSLIKTSIKVLLILKKYSLEVNYYSFMKKWTQKICTQNYFLFIISMKVKLCSK